MKPDRSDPLPDVPPPGEPGAEPGKQPTDPARLREKLRRSGFAYLQRYSASRAHFLDVMRRKGRRWVEAGYVVADVESLNEHAAVVAGEFEELGLLDDKAFAEARVASGRRKGASRLRLAMTLRQKGVEAATAEQALAGDEATDAEAALRFARRRRLGPWRRDGKGDAGMIRNREISALMRQGFGYGVAKSVVDMDLDEALSRLDGHVSEA